MFWVLLSSCSPPTLPAVEPEGEVGQEVCDGVDNDGDGLVDDADVTLDPTGGVLVYIDLDHDGHGINSDRTRRVCDPDGVPTVADDCDDMKSDVHPGAPEICDDVDNDCDGLVDLADPTCLLYTSHRAYADRDEDGWGAEPLFTCGTATPTVDTTGDCDDSAADVFPGALDLCDGVDNACQGSEDGCIPAARIHGPYAGGGSVVEAAAFGSDTTGSWVALGLPESGELHLGIPVGAAYTLSVPTTDVDVGAAATAWVAGDGGAQGTGRLIRAPGDLDGDGLADLLVESRVGYEYGRYSFDEGEVSLFLGPLSGELQPQWTLDAERACNDMDGGFDVTGDGRPDVVITGSLVYWSYYDRYGVVILDAAASGELTPWDLPTLLAVDADGVVLHPDLDGDGQADLVLGTGDVLAIPGPIPVGATWEDVTPTTISADRSFAVSLLPDMDGDGLEDIGSNGGGSLAILSSRDGLRAKFLFETGNMIRTTVMDDLDGDGLPEIAVGTVDDGMSSHEPSAVWIFSGAAQGTLSRDDAIVALPGPELEPDVPDPALAWTPGTLLIGDATGAWFVDTSTILPP